MFNIKSASISKKMIVINAPAILIIITALFIIISIYAAKSAENRAMLSILQAGYLVESSFDNILEQSKKNSENSMRLNVIMKLAENTDFTMSFEI